MAGTVAVNGDRLREARLRKGLSMRDLAGVAGVGYDTVSNLENGRQGGRISTIRKLAEALGLTPDALIAWEATGEGKAKAAA